MGRALGKNRLGLAAQYRNTCECVEHDDNILEILATSKIRRSSSDYDEDIVAIPPHRSDLRPACLPPRLDGSMILSDNAENVIIPYFHSHSPVPAPTLSHPPSILDSSIKYDTYSDVLHRVHRSPLTHALHWAVGTQWQHCAVTAHSAHCRHSALLKSSIILPSCMSVRLPRPAVIWSPISCPCPCPCSCPCPPSPVTGGVW